MRLEGSVAKNILFHGRQIGFDARGNSGDLPLSRGRLSLHSSDSSPILDSPSLTDFLELPRSREVWGVIFSVLMVIRGCLSVDVRKGLGSSTSSLIYKLMFGVMGGRCLLKTVGPHLDSNG